MLNHLYSLQAARAGIGGGIPDLYVHRSHRLTLAQLRPEDAGEGDVAMDVGAKVVMQLIAADDSAFPGDVHCNDDKSAAVPLATGTFVTVGYFVIGDDNCSTTLSRLKLAGFCRGGNSLNVFSQFAASVCKGT